MTFLEIDIGDASFAKHPWIVKCIFDCSVLTELRIKTHCVICTNKYSE